MTVWQWDPSLYSGSADYYAAGRMPYPSSVVWALRDTLGLDGTGRLLDVGSGPGTLTIPLAGFFAESVAVDADADMIAAGRSSAESLGLRSISWRALRAEELPADLGRFRVITFAQSFHWMDQPAVARTVAGMLAEGGSVVHLGASTDKGTGETPRTSLHYPKPPWDEVNELVRDYLGTKKRAGQGVRPTESFGTEREVFATAGFGAPQTVEVPHNFARIRTVNEIVAAVYSLSYSAPHLFGDRKDEFEAELRELLASRSALGGLFAEQVGSVRLTFWRAPEGGIAVPPAPRKAGSSQKSTAAKTSGAKTSSAKSSPAKTSPTKRSAAKRSPAKISPAKSAAPKSSASKSATAERSARNPSTAKTSSATAVKTSVAEAAIAEAPTPRSSVAERSARKTAAATSTAAKPSIVKAPAADETSQPSMSRSATTKRSTAKTSGTETAAAKSPSAKSAARKSRSAGSPATTK
jgi:SAM-dependent methyltransferase